MIRATGMPDALAPVMAAIQGAWCHDTTWMPKVRKAEANLGFARHLITTQTCRVPGLPEVMGFPSRDNTEITALCLAPIAQGLGHGTALLTEAKVAHIDRSGNDERLPDIRLQWRKDTA